MYVRVLCIRYVYIRTFVRTYVRVDKQEWEGGNVSDGAHSDLSIRAYTEQTDLSRMPRHPQYVRTRHILSKQTTTPEQKLQAIILCCGLTNGCLHRAAGNSTDGIKCPWDANEIHTGTLLLRTLAHWHCFICMRLKHLAMGTHVYSICRHPSGEVHTPSIIG